MGPLSSTECQLHLHCSISSLVLTSIYIEPTPPPITVRASSPPSAIKDDARVLLRVLDTKAIIIMPLFRKSKSSNPTHPSAPASPPSAPHPARSVEHLVHPALAPPGSSIEPAYSSDRRFADYPGPNYHSSLHPASQPPQDPNPSSLHRSQSQRQPHHSPRDRAFPSVVAAEDPQPRRSKRDLFVRQSSRFLERSVSVKGKPISHPISQPTSPRVPHSLDTTEEEPHSHPAFSEAQSPVTQPLYEARFASLADQQQRQRFQRAPRETPESSQQPPASAQPQSHFIPRPLERSNTDPSLLENFNRPSPAGPAPASPHRSLQQGQSQSRTQQDLVLNARPPSQQTCEPLSPVRSQNYPDAMQQAQGQQTANDRPQGSQQGSSNRRGSATQNMPEPGRNTPTPNRTREDPGEIDVRALLQKHEELRMFCVVSNTKAGYDADLTQNPNIQK